MLNEDASDDCRDGDKPGDDRHSELDVDVAGHPGGGDEIDDGLEDDAEQRQRHQTDGPGVLQHCAPVGDEYGVGSELWIRQEKGGSEEPP